MLDTSTWTWRQRLALQPNDPLLGIIAAFATALVLSVLDPKLRALAWSEL